MAVGIFDSGLGGLTVLDAVSDRMPWQSFIYYGDNANTPYGVRDPDDIYKLTTTGLEKLWDEGCDLVIQPVIQHQLQHCDPYKKSFCQKVRDA